MIGLARAVACGLFLVVCSSVALADSVAITGNVSFTQNSLTFAPPFATKSNSGSFAAFSNGTVNYLLGTVAYMNGVPQTEEAFTITGVNGDVLAFYDEVNTPTQSYDSNGNLTATLDETGYYTFNGGPAYAGSFDLGFTGNSPFGSTTNVPFLGTGTLFEPGPDLSAVTPEPGSFLLLGTGFLCMAGLLRTRSRRKV